MPLLTFPIAFIAPLTTVTVPKLSEGVAQHNVSDIKRKAGKALHATGLLAFPATAVLIPLGRDICKLIFASPDAGAHMTELCIATLFTYYQITSTAILNGIGKQRYAAAVSLICGALALGFTWCVGTYGIHAFLLGNILSCLAAAVLNIRCIARALRLRVQVRNWFVAPLLASALAGVCANLLNRMLAGEGFGIAVSAPVCICTSAVIYLIAMVAQGARPIAYFKTLIPRSYSLQ